MPIYKYIWKTTLIIFKSRFRQMNFLAHAYLSFGQPGILAGNMMGDFVKGKQKNTFPDEIKKGIELHWFIDSFTDTHPVVLEAKQAFKPLARLYSGMFVDVAFDYFLANDPAEKTEDEWRSFSQETYNIVGQYRYWFVPAFSELFYYMRMHDWLYNYRFDRQIKNSFNNVSRRAKYLPINADEVFDAFQNNVPFLKDCYERFFPELKEAALQKLDG